MTREYSFRICTRLGRDRETLWKHSRDLEQVNREFFPFLRMTFPADARELTPKTVSLGKKLFRSWILLFGVLPVEYDDIALAEMHPGKGFLETSVMFSMKAWRHRRTISDAEGGCLVEDEVGFTPRLPGIGRVQRPLISLLFAYRHRRLEALFGKPG